MSHCTGIEKGSVIQVNEKCRQPGWIGALLIVDTVKSFGVQAFAQIPKTPDESAQAYIRLNWEEIELIGKAVLLPSEKVEQL